jgi:hypothetical protein
MSNNWMLLIFAIVMVVSFGVGQYIEGKRAPLSPRQSRKESRWIWALTGPICVLSAWMAWNSGTPQSRLFAVVMMAYLAIGAVVAVRQWLGSPPEREAVANFAVDPRHCGRCEYDLTGNTSGICPECGWRIPRWPLDVDSPGWAVWWRRWTIEHLRCWRVTLAILTGQWVVVAGITAAMAVYPAVTYGAMIGALVVMNTSINIVRVAAYGWNASKARDSKPILEREA